GAQPWFFEDPFFNDEIFRRFFGQPFQQRRQQPQQRRIVQPVQGSGFLISADGYIMTNNHLVGDTQNVRVQLSDNREFEAKVIGTDPESDVAVVKIDQTNLPYLELADSDALEVGEWILAIGNPFGLRHTVTAGIVSAKGRSGIGISTYEDFIQTDAAINPGNSGGPLLNLDGKVVGMSTAIISRTRENLGIGLAIPINMAKNIYDQLVKDGKVVRGYLGIHLQDLTPDLAENFGLKESKGVIVNEVIPGSPAEEAGLEFGDIVVEFNGRKIEDRADLMNRVAVLAPETEVKLLINREGKEQTITAKLGERPKRTDTEEQTSTTLEDLGLEVKDLDDEMAARLGYEGMKGVLIVSVQQGSVASRQGIESGMLILQVNRKDVSNTRDFHRELREVKKGQTVVLLVTDGRIRRFVALRVPE
ncbi:MAG: DegQ family serine endoprotease, partial [Phycisphaerae bacterium]